MPSYVILGNYTEQGIKDVKNVRSRVEATKQVLQEAGGRLIAFYLTFGEYDFLSIVEVPNSETAARLALSVGAQGNVRTTTMQAFTEEETWAIAESLP